MGRSAIVLGRSRAERLLEALDSQGYAPLHESSAEAALDRARRKIPGLVVLVGDPASRDLAATIRLDPCLTATPLIRVHADPPPRTRPDDATVGPVIDLDAAWEAADLAGALAGARLWSGSLASRGLRCEVEFEIPSMATSLLECCEGLQPLLRSTPLKAEQIRQIRHTLLEVGQNAIEWGNRLDAGKRVWITYRAYATQVELVVRDEGEGFDPERLPQAAKAADPLAHLEVREQMGLRDGGFGLMICRGMLDAFRYNALGNEVTLTKLFPPAQPAVAEIARPRR